MKYRERRLASRGRVLELAVAPEEGHNYREREEGRVVQRIDRGLEVDLMAAHTHLVDAMEEDLMEERRNRSEAFWRWFWRRSLLRRGGESYSRCSIARTDLLP